MYFLADQTVEEIKHLIRTACKKVIDELGYIDLATPTPPTPSLPPVTSSMYTQSKRPRQAYAKRGLFKALGRNV